MSIFSLDTLSVISIRHISIIKNIHANLKISLVIPNNVKNRSGTFGGYKSLTGNITIYVNPNFYNNCFYNNMEDITLTSSYDLLDELADTADNSNVTVQ